MTRWFYTPSDLHRYWIDSVHNKRLIDGRYKLLHEIGHGATSIVHLAIDINTNKRYAIKELNKSQLERQYHSELLRESNPHNKRKQQSTLLGVSQSNNKKRRCLQQNITKIQEVEILKQIPPHENIIQLIKVIDYDDSIFMVTEIAENGVVMEVAPHSTTKPISNNQCRHIFKQLVNAVDHLHRHNIIHRDIKPQNLIIANDATTIKLIDFGNATTLSDIQKDHVKRNNSLGSPAFMAPELLKKATNHDDDYSPTCADLWSMGITLYCLAYGNLPFERPSILDLYKDIQNKPVLHSDKSRIDPTLKDLINKLLEKHPKDRITLQQVKEHPWLKR